MEALNDIAPILDALRIRHQLFTLGKNRGSILSLFDDSFFTQSDFDIIDGKTRSLLTEAFKKKGFAIKGSRFFTSPRGTIFQFAKPSHTLGCNPADKVKEALKSDTVTFTTPTQALLLLLDFDHPILKEPTFFKDFLFHQPANIKKVIQWVAHDGLKTRLIHSEFQLNEWNELGCQKAQGKL